MGQIVEVTCRICATVSHQVDGPIMAGYLPRCAVCGQPSLVPVDDVPEDPGPNPAESRRRSRRQMLEQQAGTCECGGSLTDDAPLRCPSCRSTDLAVELWGIAD